MAYAEPRITMIVNLLCPFACRVADWPNSSLSAIGRRVTLAATGRAE